MIKEFCVEMSFSYITYIGTILFGQVSATSNGKTSLQTTYYSALLGESN